MRKLSLIILITFLSCGNQSDLSKYFGDFKGTIVICDQNSDEYTIVNEKRANTRFTPFSTFKIPNSIIALETGVLANVDQFLSWDTLKYPAEDWWPKTWGGKHNLRSAIKYSVVPFYRNVASLIGTDKMQTYVTNFNYGNTDISSGIDNFWLNGSLEISAFEQVEFLKKFYTGKLPVSLLSTESVKSILIQESKEDYTLSYKTGAGTIDTETNYALGWLVGYVEKQGNVYYFAMNIEGISFEDVLAPRVEITKSILREPNIIN